MDRVLDTLHVQCSEILYVGDTDIDMQTAHSSGAAAAAACWGYQSIEQLMPDSPEHATHAPGDLIEIYQEVTAMFSEMKKEIIDAGIMLDRYELVSLTCGNLSVRMPSGEILVTPSGMMYEKMVEDDMIVMDLDGNIIEGTRKPSSDTPAILHIFRERPDINAVIHTHQPYATAVSLIPGLTEFRVCITALANAAGGNVPITPYSAAGSIDMGIDTVKYVGDGHAVILSQHGVMTVGKDLNQALYAAVYLEEAAKCYLAARAACVNGETKQMSDAQIQQMVDVFKYYGQGTATIPQEMVQRLG